MKYMKKWIKKHIPTKATLKKNKYLKGLSYFFHDPNLWHLNCHSIATAASIGCFIGYLPFPGHMIMATGLSIVFRANLPIAVAMVWISNPITIPFMFYFAYRVGAHILQTPPESFHIEENYQWLLQEFDHFAFPSLVGSLICGFILALCANIIVRLYFRRTPPKRRRRG
jgi:uncharacterized protein (DUF2062 family)